MEVLKVLIGFGGLILFSVVVLGGLLDTVGPLGIILAMGLALPILFNN